MTEGAVGCLLFVWGRDGGGKVGAMILGSEGERRYAQGNDTRGESNEEAGDRERMTGNRCEWMSG